LPDGRIEDFVLMVVPVFPAGEWIIPVTVQA
jgi:hypothetical protein